MIDHRIELPSSSAEVIIKYREDYLTEFELTEVIEFEQIYYLASNAHKTKPTKAERLVNNGFDDADGYYKIIIGDHLGYRY